MTAGRRGCRWAYRPRLLPGLIALALAACAAEETPPAEVALSNLVAYAERYDGQRVATAGVVRTFPDPRHYWIEDDALNRVEIRPPEAVASNVGEHVRVTGRFRHSREAGRVLTVDGDATPVP